MSDRKRSLNDLRVIDLRLELEKRNLDKSGVRCVLVQRLSKYLEEEGHDPNTFKFELAADKTPNKKTQRSDSIVEPEPEETPAMEDMIVLDDAGEEDETEEPEANPEVASNESQKREKMDVGTTSEPKTTRIRESRDEPEVSQPKKPCLEKEIKSEENKAPEYNTDAEDSINLDLGDDELLNEQSDNTTKVKKGDEDMGDDNSEKKDKKENSEEGGARNLWVSGLSGDTRAKDLKQLCSKHGKVIGAKVVTNARTPGSRCYGYVTMASAQDADNCITNLHRTELHGRMISVEKAKCVSESSSRCPLPARPADRRSSTECVKDDQESKKNNASNNTDNKEEKKDGEMADADSTRSVSRTREKSHRSEKGRRNRSREGKRSPQEVLSFSKIWEERDLTRARERSRAAREERRRRRAAEEAPRERERRQRQEKHRLAVEREELGADSFLVGYTKGERSSALTRHSPLETPLHPKRQRTFEFYDQSTNKLVEFEDNSPSALSDEVMAPVILESGSGNAVPLPPQNEILPPSSVASGIQRGLANQDIDFYINYGSEDESAEEGDGDEDPSIPAFVPRACSMFLDVGDDDNDYSPLGQTSGSAPAPNEPLPVNETPSLDYRPKDLFDYDWASFPSVPVPPTERRETFRGVEVGPTAVFPSPYDAFAAIWTPEFMQKIVVETNRYAQQMTDRKIREGGLGPNSRITRWHKTDVDELYVYFALLLAMGLCPKGDVKEYWSNDDVTFTPVFGRYMSYNRFLLLTSCLHFMDNRMDLRTLTKPQAKAAKIQPVIEHLNNRFQALYNLNQNIAIDESLTQWKGSLAFRQFMNTKAARVGLKTYELCESQTGYLWRFKLYSGREEETEGEVTPVSGYIVTLVLDLLKGLENKGHTVWMDNFYNSPALARVMKTLGFDCVGTLRTGRQGVPPQIKNLKKEHMAPGQIYGCTSGDVDILVWRDANRVAMISTYHGAAVHTARGTTKPTVVYDYNVCMGGVDKKDQMLSAYPLERKRTRVWYKKFFRRLLNASVLNAFILHRGSAVPNSQPHTRNHRVFRKTLVSQLLNNHVKRRILSVETATTSKRGPSAPILSQEVLQHCLQQYGYQPGKKGKMRRRCVVCHKPSYTYCPACNVTLCMDECTKKYHSS